MELEVRVTSITGEQGQVRWAYHVAATIHPWTVTKTESGQWALAGTSVSADTFRLSQRPLVFVAPNGWRWPIVELQSTGASFLAMLGPKESSHGTVRPTSDYAPADQRR